MSYHQLAGAFPLLHLWSLSVEEQFYLLWPFVVKLSRNSYISLAVILGMPLLRALLWLTGHRLPLNYLISVSIDALAMGCWLAQSGSKPKVRFPFFWLLIGFALISVVPEHLVFGRKVFRLLQDSVVHGCIGLGILGSLYGNGWWFRFLNSKPMRWLGVLSYSLYLWQELFVHQPWPMAVRVLAILLSGVISYALIERPFLAFKERFASHSAMVESAAV